MRLGWFGINLLQGRSPRPTSWASKQMPVAVPGPKAQNSSRPHTSTAGGDLSSSQSPAPEPPSTILYRPLPFKSTLFRFLQIPIPLIRHRKLPQFALEPSRIVTLRNYHQNSPYLQVRTIPLSHATSISRGWFAPSPRLSWTNMCAVISMASSTRDHIDCLAQHQLNLFHYHSHSGREHRLWKGNKFDVDTQSSYL